MTKDEEQAYEEARARLKVRRIAELQRTLAAIPRPAPSSRLKTFDRTDPLGIGSGRKKARH